MQRTGWVQWLVPLILRSRRLTHVVIAVVSALAGIFVTRITIDTSLQAWFLEDNASIVRYKQFREQFGEDAFVVLAIESDNVFTPRVLAELASLTTIAEQLPMVRRVTSLTNVEVLRRRSDGTWGTSSLMENEQPPQTAEEAGKLQEEAASHPLIAGSLFSEDGRLAAVVVELARECDTLKKQEAVVREFSARSRDHLPGLRVRLAGTPVVSAAISHYIRRDLGILTPASFVVTVVAIYLLFRRVAVPLISITVVALASLWVLGAMGMLGVQMNLLGPVLIMVVLVMGVADSIHIFSAYFQELEHADTQLEAIDRALNHVLVPCSVTSLTTIAGFLSLLSSDLAPIRHFGALAALGTALAFAISIFLIPALIHLVPKRKRKADRAPARTTMGRVLHLLGHPTQRVSWTVLILSALILVPSIWSIQQIRITANPMNYFHANDPVRQDGEAVDAMLGGAATLEFIVHAPDGGMKDLDVLERLDAFEVWLEQLPAVNRIMSFGSLLKEVDRTRRDKKKGQLPNNWLRLRMARERMEEASPDLIDSYVQDDFSLGRISVRVRASEADKVAVKAPEIEDVIRTWVNGPDLEVLPTGFVMLMEDMRTYLIRGMVTSVILAFATITLVLLVLFRSWKLALFSMIPNVGPIILGLAFMVAVDIYLDPGTVMIATIALGLVVDDTCHFLVRLRTYISTGMSLPEAVAETMKQTGRPIILTSIILATGFMILVLGSFTPTLCFGLVSAFVLLVALVADLVVLPAALLILRPKL